MDEYEIGTSVECEAEFKNLLHELFDPGTVVCIIRKPDGTETTYTYGVDVALARVSKGLYQLWVLTDAVGAWYYKFRGSGPQTVTKTFGFMVNASPVTTP